MRNCLGFVLSIARYGRTSDHLVIRKSHWGWFPHFSAIFELQDDTVVKKEYVPTAPRKRWSLPIFFEGKIVTTVYKKVSVEETTWEH
jgi:hypothetical protein